MRKGSKHTEEAKEKCRKAAIGRVGYWKGKKRPESTKKKISENNAYWWKGKTKSIEYRRNMGKNRKGANNPSWKGGVTPKNKRIRESLDYTLWRKAVFQRDNFTCQKYGIRGGKLRAHHINNFADFPELRLAIDNGITLSDEAHKDFHRKYGIRNNTKEQLEEFLIS